MMYTLLYHRVGAGKYSNSPKMMEDHLSWIAKRFQVLLPGEPFSIFSRNVCLTFDDATYDFYHYVFPLLKKLKVRALLSVPTKFIKDNTTLKPIDRLAIPYSIAMKEDIYRTHCPFCTWEELHEMAHSGFVEIASHSVQHKHLLTPGLDWKREIQESKKILEDKLQIHVRTFVYPLGKFDQIIHQEVLEHYDFAMRIGTAWNTSWYNWSNLTYRIICDNLTSPNEFIRLLKKMSYLWFYTLNSLRRR